MGRLFEIEKEGPVYSCLSCGTQIAHRDHLLNDWTDFHEFSEVYNTFIGETMVRYGYFIDGYEVSCVKCLKPLGCKLKEAPGHETLYHIQNAKVVPPPEVQSPPEVQPPPEFQAPSEVQAPPEVQAPSEVQAPTEVQSPPEVV